MFSLFPKSLFASLRRDSAQLTKAADQFKEEWRQLLAAALGRVLSIDGIDPAEVVARLAESPPAKLAMVDLEMRRGHWSYPDRRAAPIRRSPTPITANSSDVEAYLFTAACNSNGYLRERALTVFEHYPGRLAVAAALIRCDDWVPAVQQAAVNLLVKLLAADAASLLFEQMPLLLRLKQRQRMAEHVWPEKIEPALRLPGFREQRWKCTRTHDPETRAFAYRLVLDADPDRTKEALESACADGHPKVASWGLATAGAVLGQASAESLLRRALNHRSTAVRSFALRRYGDSGAADLGDVLERAIFDESQGPRDAAAYLLDKRFGVSALSFWRKAIESRDPASAAIAVTALAYVAEAGDGDRLMPYRNAPVARVRAYALRGLARAKSPKLEECLMEALGDTSSVVVRSALRVFATEGPALEAQTLKQAYAQAPSDAVRRRLLHGSRLLGKWETLGFLLPLVETVDSAAAITEIERWQRTSIRRFTPMDSGLRVALTSGLTNLQDKRPSSRWADILEMVRRS